MQKVRLVLLVGLFVACGSQSVFSIDVGTCFDDTEAEQVSSVPEVDCSEPHDNEAFALIDYTESGSYPGEEELRNRGTELCIEQFEAYVGLSYPESDLAVFPITPSEASWNDDDDREIICALYALDLSKLTGSMRGAAR
jgi:hypothetical protein